MRPDLRYPATTADWRCLAAQRLPRFLFDYVDGGAGDGAGFTDGAGALLRDGAFRRQVSDTQVEALRSLARRRFLSLMTGSR